MLKNYDAKIIGCQCLLTSLLEWVVLVSSVLVAGVLAYLVIARYVFNWPTTGLHTIVIISAMWLYMSGALLASRNRQHLVVDYLAVKIGNGRLKEGHELMVALIQFAIVLIFVYWTWRMFAWGSRYSTTMPELGIPIWIPQLAIAFNAIGSTCYALRDIRNATLKLIYSRS